MSSRIPKVTAVRPLAGYSLHVKFDDGAEGTIDLAGVLSFRGVFEPCRDRSFFRRVQVNSELGTIVWPNGADFDPIVLHSLVIGSPIKIARPTARKSRS